MRVRVRALLLLVRARVRARARVRVPTQALCCTLAALLGGQRVLRHALNNIIQRQTASTIIRCRKRYL